MNETTITAGNQTQVPSSLRSKYGLEPGDVVVWEDADGNVRIRFRRRHRLTDLVGAFGGGKGGDALRDKKRAQRGGAGGGGASSASGGTKGSARPAEASLPPGPRGASLPGGH